MSTRSQNEKKFGEWEDLPGRRRRYRLDVAGRLGWLARYWKEVDANETTVRFWQEIYNDHEKLVETHEKYPVDKDRRTMTITKQTVADQIAAYLHHEMTLAQLVGQNLVLGTRCRIPRLIPCAFWLRLWAAIFSHRLHRFHRRGWNRAQRGNSLLFFRFCVICGLSAFLTLLNRGLKDAKVLLWELGAVFRG